jgi:hypothetical protein
VSDDAGWDRLVAAAYDSLLKAELERGKEHYQQMSRELEERRLAHEAWLASQTRWFRIRYVAKQRARRARAKVRKHWHDGRYWLSNKIYTHEGEW